MEAATSPETLNLRHLIGSLTAGHRTDLEKLVFSASLRRGFSFSNGPGWVLAMRMIKCLKGNWWMPWHAQAMKDVIRCDKLRGGANTL